MSAAPALTTLTALAQALSRPAPLTASLEAALATVAELLGLETGWVWLLDDGVAEPILAAARALPAALRDHPDAMRGDCHCLSTFRAGDLRGAANVSFVRCSRLARVLEDPGDGGGLDLRCHASVPLVVGGRRLGMLNVASRDWRVLSADELNVLTTAGALVSLAIERSRLEAAGARAAAADERNRIAREIHDTLAQSLAGLTLQLELAEALTTAGDDGALAAAVTRALALARGTLADARRSVLDLREAPLAGLPLPDALAAMIEALPRQLGAQPDIVLDVAGFGDAAPLPAAITLGLHRIAEQALRNALQHAGAGRIVVTLRRADDGVRLRVCDDGTGFDPGAVPGDRYGIVGMRERARLLGGTLDIASGPDGSTVDVVIPLGAPAGQGRFVVPPGAPSGRDRST
jgi:two-component system, NarL family, sensor kinase